QPAFEGHLRRPAERVLDERRVRRGTANVAQRRLAVDDLERGAGDLLRDRDRVPDARLHAAADVVDGAARASRESELGRGDDVAHVGEAPRLVPVAEYLDA